MIDIEELYFNYSRENHLFCTRSELCTFISNDNIEFFSNSGEKENEGEISKDHKWCRIPSNWLDDEILNQICSMKNLLYLDLVQRDNAVKQPLPSSFSKLKNLRYLCFYINTIGSTPEAIRNFKQLEVLWFFCRDTSVISKWIGELKQLRKLFILGKSICNLPEELFTLKRLEHLSIFIASIDKLPKYIYKLENLTDIELNSSGIKKLPKDIPPFKKLMRLDLSGLTLDEIPEWVFTQNLPFVFDENRFPRECIMLRGVQLLHQPISLFEMDREFIKAYYEAEKVRLNEVKVIFLGDGEAGKSHIIQRMKNNGELLDNFGKETTPGIEISKLEMGVGDETMRLQLWDFGGQEILHSMHRFFLTERTLYVVVLNCRDNTQDQRAIYWLNNIKSFAHDCPVILVLNKIDQNKSADVNENALRRDYPAIRDVLRMSAKCSTKVEFDRLIISINHQVSTFDSFGMDFPTNWDSVRSALQEMGTPYITDSDYRAICTGKGVTEKKIQDWLLEWFHDLGVSFYYRKMGPDLREYMVLKPQWITNAVNILIFNGQTCSQNGIIAHADIERLLAKPPKAVMDGLVYTSGEIPYILAVMRRFEISYGLDGEFEFIPALCEKNENHAANAFYSGISLEYRMEYAYLPDNVLHKLMIRMYGDLQRKYIWKTGAIFNGICGLCDALIKVSQDKEISIYVQSKNKDFAPAYAYLGVIRDRLMEINRELGLNAEDVIVYKKDGMQEKIPYDSVRKRIKKGIGTYFSDQLEEEINIRDIVCLVEGEKGAEAALKLCKEETVQSVPALRAGIVQENTARWLHISDIHFNYAPATVDMMREQLLQYLPGKVGRLDYIFITGDLRYKNSPYDGVAEFIERLSSSLNVTRDRIFIVPGNHDVERCTNREDTAQGVKGSYKATVGEIHSARMGILLEGQSTFNDVYRQIKDSDYAGAPQPHFSITMDKLNILHLNTALTCCKDGEDGTLILGTKAVHAALKSIDKTKPTIALAHHAFECLAEDERQQLEIHLKQCGVSLYLCGHFHKIGGHAICRVNQMDNLFEFLCGTNMDCDPSNKPTHMDVLIGHMNLETRRGYIEAHKWVPDSGVWVPDGDFALPQKESDARLYYPPEERKNASFWATAKNS